MERASGAGGGLLRVEQVEGQPAGRKAGAGQA